MAVDLAKLVVTLSLESAQFLKRAEAAEAQVKKLEKTTEQAGSKFAKNLNRAIVGVVGAFAALTKHAIDNADQLDRISQATGIATEQLSALQYSAKLADVSQEALFKSFTKIALSATEAQKGTGKAAEAYKALGIDVKDANGKIKGQQELLYEIADAFAAAEDGTAKAAIAQAILGKGSQQLIPLLNAGSAALKEQAAEAKELGLIIDTKTAKAADAFNDNLVRLQSVATGAATILAAELLPSFVEMTDEFVQSSKNGGAMRAVFDGLAATLKGIVSVALYAGNAIASVGRAAGAAAAIVKLTAEGEFTAAMKVYQRVTLENEKAEAETIARIARIWAGLPEEVEKTADKTNKATKKILIFNPAEAASEAAKAAEAAMKSFSDKIIDLQTSVATFGMGPSAIARYSAESGELKKQLDAAGKAGQPLVDQIVDLTRQLEVLDTQKALQDVDAQILQMTGHTKEAAIAAFDMSNALLRASLTDTGDAAGIAKLDTLRKLTAEQAEFNEATIKYQEIAQNLAIVEDQITHSAEVGAINQLEALSQLDAARMHALEEMGKEKAAMDAIAASSSNPEIIKGAKEAGTAFDELRNKTGLLAQEFRTTFEDAATGPLAEFIKGTQTASEAWTSFVDNLEGQIADFIAKDLIRRAFGDILGSTTSAGTGGGWIGAIAGIFGGKRDSGGRGSAGRAYAIGTGAQPEMFIPDTSGTFVPRGAGGGTIVNNFTVNAGGGEVSRRTQEQIAAAAARGIATAHRRGN